MHLDEIRCAGLPRQRVVLAGRQRRKAHNMAEAYMWQRLPGWPQVPVNE